MEESKNNPKNIRLLLQCEGGYPPYLTPYILNKYFPSTSSLIINHLLFGIEIRDACSKAIYETSTCKKPKEYTFQSHIVHTTLNNYNTLLCPIWSWDTTTTSSSTATNENGSNNNQRKKKKQEMIIKKEISNQNRDKYIILPTHNGNQKLQIQTFTDNIICNTKTNTTFKISMYDYISNIDFIHLKSKRIIQCYNRTMNWYEHCMNAQEEQQQQLILPMLLLSSSKEEGSSNNDTNEDTNNKNIDYIKLKQEEIMSKYKSKYIESSAGIAYYYNNNLQPSFQIDNEQQKELHTLLKQKNKLIININSNTMHDIIYSIISYDMNVIGTNLPQLYARKGFALILHLDDDDDDENEQSSSSPVSKKQKIMNDKPMKKVFSVLNLNNASIKEDNTPISTNTCVSKQYTKSYVYHLIQVKEILREILLFIHNLDALLKLFEWISYCQNNDDDSWKDDLIFSLNQLNL